MRSFFKAKKLLFAYVLLVGWIALAAATHFFEPNFITFTIVFLLLLVLPGFSLARICNFDLKGVSERLVLYTSIGFVYAFLLISIAILAALSVNSLLFIYLVLMGLMFLGALLKDLYGTTPKEISFGYRKIFQLKSLPVFIFLLVVGGYYVLVSAQGSNFTGDPFFHLAYVEKAFGGQGLSIGNLGFVKNTLHIAYGFPVWHVFVAMLAKIQGLDIVQCWYFLPSPLFLLVVLAWYFIFRQIFNSRFLAIIGVFFFLSFNSEKSGYIFTRLAVPDTLNQLLLLPMLVGLTLKLVFHKVLNYKILAVSILMALFLGLIHGVQYFYYFAMMIVFGAVYFASNFWRKDYWPPLRKILTILLIHASALLLILIVLQLKGNFVGQYLHLYLSIPRDALFKIDWRFLLFLPVMLIFIRSNPKVSFAVASLLIVPLVSIQTVQKFIIQIPNIGSVFLNRIPQNVTWPFLFWTMILAFVILVIDRFYNIIRIKGIRALISALLAFGLGILILLEIQPDKPDYYLTITKPAVDWVYGNGVLVFSVSLALVIGLLLLGRFKPKTNRFFEGIEPKNYLVSSLLLGIAFLVIIPSWRGELPVVFNKNHAEDKSVWTATRDIREKILDPTDFGGKVGDEYIQDLPAKSVFLVFSSHATTFPALFDQFIVAYPQSPELETYQKIYDPAADINTKVELLKTGKVDYVLLAHTEIYSPATFDTYPDYFTQVFNQNDTAIYAVNKDRL
jgi:hypothetical protein